MVMIDMSSGFQIMLTGMLIKLLEWVLLEQVRQKQLGNKKRKRIINKLSPNKMVQLLFKRKIKEVGALLQGYYFEVKAWYIQEFNRMPCVSFIGELDTTKAYAYINEQYTYEIVAVYQHAYFDHDEKKMYFNNTVFFLTNNRMLELGNNYCQVLHTNKQYAWANELIRNLAEFRMVTEKERTVIGFARQTTAN